MQKGNYGKLIGKGTFSKVYRNNEDGIVTVISCDPVKECMSNNWFPDDSLFPQITSVDYDEYSTYTMPFYEKVKSPKKELTKYSFELYQALRKYFLTLPFCQNAHDSYYICYNHIATIPAKFSKEKALLRKAFDCLANYGSTFSFEISPRNISKTKRGKLVLLDCFYSRELLLKTRTK